MLQKYIEELKYGFRFSLRVRCVKNKFVERILNDRTSKTIVIKL